MRFVIALLLFAMAASAQNLTKLLPNNLLLCGPGNPANIQVLAWSGTGGCWVFMTPGAPGAPLLLGSSTFLGSVPFTAQSHGSQNNVLDYSPLQAMLGPATTTAQTLDTHIHAFTAIGSREAAGRFGAINPYSTGNTNWETDGVTSVVVNYNPPQTNSGHGYSQQGNIVVAGSFMAIGAAAGSAVFPLNTLVRDYDYEFWGPGQHWPSILIGAEMDMSIADTGTSGAGINMNIEWKNGKPTPPSTGLNFQQAGTGGSAGAYFTYGLYAWDYATENAITVGLKGGTTTGETAHIELLSGTSTKYFNHIWGSASGGFTFWPDLTHNTANKVYITETGAVKADAYSGAGNQFTCSDSSGTLYVSAGPCLGVLPAFADNEIPAGAIDGTNATYTLAHAPNPGNSLHVERNGLGQQAGGYDFTLAGAVITFITAAIPQPGDSITATYRY